MDPKSPEESFSPTLVCKKEVVNIWALAGLKTADPVCTIMISIR
jgi:hypothetical protein